MRGTPNVRSRSRTKHRRRHPESPHLTDKRTKTDKYPTPKSAHPHPLQRQSHPRFSSAKSPSNIAPAERKSNKFCKPFANRVYFSEKNKKKTPDFFDAIRGLSGGRSRTRTYDPLIKRLMRSVRYQGLRSKLSGNMGVMSQ